MSLVGSWGERREAQGSYVSTAHSESGERSTVYVAGVPRPRTVTLANHHTGSPPPGTLWAPSQILSRCSVLSSSL